jgi:hypothetical protein
MYKTRNISFLIAMINFDFVVTHQLCSFLEFSLKPNKVDGLWLRWRNIKRGKHFAAYTDGNRKRLR